MPKEDNNGNQIWRALRLIGARSCKPGRRVSPARAPDPPLVGTCWKEPLGRAPEWMPEMNDLKCFVVVGFFFFHNEKFKCFDVGKRCRPGLQGAGTKPLLRKPFPRCCGAVSILETTLRAAFGQRFAAPRLDARGAEVPGRDALPSPPSRCGAGGRRQTLTAGGWQR